VHAASTSKVHAANRSKVHAANSGKVRADIAAGKSRTLEAKCMLLLQQKKPRN
jgi:hypothetical protein